MHVREKDAREEGPDAGSSSRVRLRWTPGLLLAAIILAGLLARLPLVALPGHGYDLGFFIGWTEAVHEKGLEDAQEATPPVDYPGFPVLLWPIAELYGPFLDEPVESDELLARLVKLPGVVGDLLMVAALFFFTRSLARRSPAALTGALERLPVPGSVSAEDRAGLLAAFVFAFNPAVIYGSALWGQIDSLIALAMLGALAATMARRPGLGGMALALGFALKPQVLVIAPAIVIVSLIRSGPRALAWLAAGFAAGLVLALGFFVVNGGGDEIIATYGRISGYQHHVSYNAWNIWWPAEVGANPRPGDPALQLAGYAIPYRLLGLAALVPAGVILFLFLRRSVRGPAGPDRELLVAGGFVVLSFFMLATAIHERYAIYALGIMAPVVVFDRRWGAMYAALSLMVLLNVSASLPPGQTWARLVNGPVFSMSMASANLVVYALFSGLMLLPGDTDVRRRGQRGEPCYEDVTGKPAAPYVHETGRALT